MKTALLIVDVQNDFMPGGSLAVPDSDQIIPIVNRLIPNYELVVATQDWHPANHGSFASNHQGTEIGDVIDLDGLQQVMWPDHCVQQTNGAQFSPQLNAHGVHAVVQKGTHSQIDSYSGFFDNARRNQTELESVLREQSVTEVHIVGVATDYCVKFTAFDAVDLQFKTVVVTDGVRGVNLAPGDCDRAMSEMSQAGISFCNSADLVST